MKGKVKMNKLKSAIALSQTDDFNMYQRSRLIYDDSKFPHCTIRLFNILTTIFIVI